MLYKVVAVAVLLGLFIGIFEGTRIEAQTEECLDGSYITVTRGGYSSMLSTSGNTLLLKLPTGNSTLQFNHNWKFGYTLYQGDVSTLGLMTVNATITRAPSSTAVTVNSVIGKQYVLVELDCSSTTSAIASKTFTSSNQVQGIILNWITNCSVSVDVGFNGYLITGVVLVPFNSNRVTGFIAVFPESYIGRVNLRIVGTTSIPSLPFSVYSGKWESMYYLKSDKNSGQATLGYTESQNLAAYMGWATDIVMGYTSLSSVGGEDTYEFAASTTPVIYSGELGLSVDPTIEPHNAINTAFTCP